MQRPTRWLECLVSDALQLIAKELHGGQDGATVEDWEGKICTTWGVGSVEDQACGSSGVSLQHEIIVIRV